MFKNLLFDLDGTLLNSYEGIYNSFVYTFKKHKIDFPKNGVKAFIGPPLVDSFRTLINDEATINLMVLSYREHYLPKGQFESSLYEGVIPMLDNFYKRGYNLYIATCKPDKIAREILKTKGIDKYFKGIYAAIDDSSASTKQAVLKNLFHNEKIEKNKSLMIGDSIYDILGAEDSGIKVAIATYGFGDLEDMKKHSLEFLFDNPLDLITLL